MDQQKSFNNNKLDLNTRHRALGENTAVEPIFARQCVFLCYPADYHPWLTAEDATALLKPAHNQVLYVYEASITATWSRNCQVGCRAATSSCIAIEGTEVYEVDTRPYVSANLTSEAVRRNPGSVIVQN
jgi:hypothetical protein